MFEGLPQVDSFPSNEKRASSGSDSTCADNDPSKSFYLRTALPKESLITRQEKRIFFKSLLSRLLQDIEKTFSTGNFMQNSCYISVKKMRLYTTTFLKAF